MRFAFLALLSTSAFAGTAELTWVAPTENTDNTPYTNPYGYKTYSGCIQSGEYEGEMVIITDPAQLIHTYDSLPDGVRCYFVVTALNDQMLESDFSNEVFKDMPYVPPFPPTDLVVSEDIAYTLVQTRDTLSLVPVGQVPVGTACDGVQDINGLYVVPYDAVTWFGTVRSEVVVAACLPQ